MIFVKPFSAATWKFLGEPVLLVELDLGSFSGTVIGPRRWAARLETEVIAVANDAGRLNGILVFFETELSPGNWLSTRPGTVSNTCHWQNWVQILPAPFDVSPGDTFLVKYQYRTNDGGGRVAIQPRESLGPAPR